MCVLVVENDKYIKPLHSKSSIIILGKFEEQLYQKSQHYATVLKYSSICLINAKSVGDKRILQKRDCKNVFCNTKLPYDEVTVIRPPIGDPDFQADKY